MVLGMWLFFSPISNILGYIPLVGGILKSTVGFILFVAALLICIPLYLIAFSLAWLWYHPKVGIAIFLVAIAILVTIIVLNNRGSSGDTAAATQTAKHLWQNLRYYQ
jgi:ABC-type multidrug transport system fused ATPase/permease subunit